MAQVAGGVPAMCDGVTQGETGHGAVAVLARRDRAVDGGGLSHHMFDAAVYLGVCDKIVPGLIIGALTFGHLPAVFMPAGPMTIGPAQRREGARSASSTPRARSARDELLEAEAKSYHGPGTCTFYGTANSNQMLMEIMGLHLPGSSFVNPGTPLRDALTRAAAKRALSITALGNDYTPIGRIYRREGDRQRHRRPASPPAARPTTRIHLIAMAAAAGIAAHLGGLRRPLRRRAAAEPASIRTARPT